MALPQLRALAAEIRPFDELLVLAPPELLVYGASRIDVYDAPSLERRALGTTSSR